MLANEIHALQQKIKTDNVNNQVTFISDTFQRCVNACAPFVTKTIRRPFAPWISDDLKSVMSKWNNKQRELKLDRFNDTLQTADKNLKVQVKSAISAARKYYKKGFNDNRGDVRSMWRVVRHLIHSKSTDNNCWLLGIEWMS